MMYRYRTGKSYLLNMLMGQTAGFQVGPTVNACTKGIWLWGKAITLEDRSNLHVLFLDTEGLDSTTRDATCVLRLPRLPRLAVLSHFVF